MSQLIEELKNYQNTQLKDYMADRKTRMDKRLNTAKEFTQVSEMSYEDFVQFYRTLPQNLRGSTVYETKKCLLKNSNLVKQLKNMQEHLVS